MKTLSALLILLFVFSSTACRKSTEEIVQNMAGINMVQAERIGFGGEKSRNYQNFEKLKKRVDNSTLLQLVNHENAVVSCYASWALVDREYPDLAAIFNKFLKENKKVTTFSGCIFSSDYVSNEFYHHYWAKVENKESDKTLTTLDSLIIYQNNPDWLLLRRALENRVYPKTYNPQISFLAFEQGLSEAIFYLSDWFKEDYKDEIFESLIKYMIKTDFSEVGTSQYFSVVEEVLTYNGKAVRQQVIKKLQQDKHWKNDSIRFNKLLKEKNIYLDDIYFPKYERISN